MAHLYRGNLHPYSSNLRSGKNLPHVPRQSWGFERYVGRKKRGKSYKTGDQVNSLEIKVETAILFTSNAWKLRRISDFSRKWFHEGCCRSCLVSINAGYAIRLTESQNEMEEPQRNATRQCTWAGVHGAYSAQERSRWVSAIKRRDGTRKHLQCRCNPLSCRSPSYRVLNIDAIAGKRKQKRVVR